MTFTLTPISVKKADGTETPMIAYNDGTNNSFANAQLDATGAIISPATSGLQTTANSALASIATNTTNIATSALQSTANTSLAAIASAVASATPAGTNVIGSVSAAANTTGGASTYCATGGTGNALLTNAPVAVKASPGSLYGFDFVNTGAAAAYVQLFDLASGAVTLGTTVPKMAKWVPAGGAWEEKFTGEAKVAFSTAITVAATTTPTGGSAPATGILANIVYK